MFSEKTFAFLRENRLQNDREWFAAHREDYETHVLEPLKELMRQLGPELEKIDGELVTTPRVDKTISRIYRDVRFSADKSLYRENIWLSVKRDKRLFVQYPEFYFVASRKGFFYGCGYYATSPEAMDSIRELVLEDDPFFQKADAVLQRNPSFVMDTDAYKRPRYPDMPPEKQKWLDRKTIRVSVQSEDLSLLYREDLAKQLLEQYRKMAPVYRFLIHAESLKRKR